MWCNLGFQLGVWLLLNFHGIQVAKKLARSKIVWSAFQIFVKAIAQQVNSIVQMPTLRVSQLNIKYQSCENLGSFGHRIREKITGKPTLVSARFAVSWHVFKINPLFSIPRIVDCFNVFSKSKAFHGIIFQGKCFTFTFCKPCNLFVNLWTFNFCSVQKMSNSCKVYDSQVCGWRTNRRFSVYLFIFSKPSNFHNPNTTT